ncbi:MAG: phosphonate metabolism protein/1,5-bisphosphokinase (PRPP-forming) PhnN [Hyphomicrobiaceae bacterium]
MAGLGERKSDGLLVLVVGPSGAGKDTLISAAKAALAADERFVFARRIVTRTAYTAAEDHASLTREEFDAHAEIGGFALTWQAHNLSYGLPATIIGDLRAGRIVVANVSRGVTAAAKRLPGSQIIVYVTAHPDILTRRLMARGRESAQDIADRVMRAQADIPVGAVEIRNNGTIEAATGTFVALLRHLADVKPDQMRL